MTDTQRAAHDSSPDSRFSASSTGQPGTASAGLDSHFAVNRPEYEAMCRSVGIQPGWRVLDAGCGPGSFLPTLADLVGPDGSIAAFDLAPENAALAEERAHMWQLPCPVEARVGSVMELPYSDDEFDAVWCANTTQYLSDDELTRALAEMRRVVRPGGLIAVKEVEPTLDCILPGDPLLYARYRDAMARTTERGRIGLRGRGMYHWLRDAGLVEIWQRLVPIERFAPFDAATKDGYGHIMPFRARTAADSPYLSPADKAAWQAGGDVGRPDNPLNSPDAYLCEGNVLAVGRVP